MHSQQAAFVKGRYIGEGIRLISDLMHYAEEEDLMGMILALDLTKAFDSLSHMFSLNCLEAFDLVHLSYSGLEHCILILAAVYW